MVKAEILIFENSPLILEHIASRNTETWKENSGKTKQFNINASKKFSYSARISSLGCGLSN